MVSTGKRGPERPAARRVWTCRCAAALLAALALDASAQRDGEAAAEEQAADAQGAVEQIDAAVEALRRMDLDDGDPNDDGGGAAADLEVQSSDERPPPVGRLETLLEMNRLADEERYEEALSLSEQLLSLTEAEFGPESLQTAEAYQTVARIQRQAGEHLLAEENYLHAVEVVRNVDGTFSELAIEPLVGLGDSYHQAGQYLNAVTAYNEARTINRRVYGLLNERQFPILDRITESFTELEQYQEAHEQQREILTIAERSYPEGSPEYLAAIYRYAEWLRESGSYHEERAQYARAQRIIRDMHGKESPLLVKPLRETGNSYRSQRIPDGQGISALRSALELLEMSAEPEPLAMAEVLRDIGDWEVAFSRIEPELSVYREAWRLLGDVEGGDELRSQWFDELQNVLGEPISQRGLSQSPDALPGHVVVQFDVDRSGLTQNVRVVQSEPAGMKDDAVARAVRRWRFRPFMEDGEIVLREDLALQFNYRYLPDEGGE